jgi:putative glutamine amidotransferase
MSPLIAISTYGPIADGQFHLPREYVDAVRRAGGVPVLAPPGESDADELLASVHGLVLAGGGDVDPKRYGGRPHPTIYNVDPDRDATEVALVRSAVARGTPTLAICRGIQVLNVALGGTLIEHLPDVVGEAVLHRRPPRSPADHEVAIERESCLAALLGLGEADEKACRPAQLGTAAANGCARLHVASWHHQAIRDLAPGLAVVAHAPDGTVEAVEMPTHRWLIGVQWHPELTADRDATQQRLFAALVEAAAEYRMVRKQCS